MTTTTKDKLKEQATLKNHWADDFVLEASNVLGPCAFVDDDEREADDVRPLLVLLTAPGLPD